MATYKEIKGVTVQTRDEDPSLFEGSWSSGGNMNTAKGQASGAGLSNSAAIIFGGYTGSPARVAINESYNGTSFTEVNDMNTARAVGAGFGSQTAAIAAAGFTPPSTANAESWDGTNWTEVNNVNTARYYVAGCGSTPAGLIAGGFSPPGTHAFTETWDGTSWTEVNDLNTAVYGAAVLGTSTAALAAAGNRPSNSPNSALTEQWDGSSWTEVGDMNSGRSATTGQGLYTNGLVFSGYIPPSGSTKTEAWNGTSWTEVNNLANGRDAAASAGSQTSALCAGKETGGVSNLAEEWAFPSSPILTEGDLFLSGGTTLKGFGKAAGIPAGTWATGGTLNAGHGYGTGFGGAQTAAVCCFGGYPTHTNNTETYNGTSWTEVNEGNTARRNLGSFGVLTSGLAFAGGPPFGSAITESWDGTSWTETGDLPNGTYNNRGIGTSSAAGLSVGGSDNTTGLDALVFEWSGSSWSEITEMSTNRAVASTAKSGSTTAGLVFGGESPSLTVNTELWNGSPWTELNNLNTARGDAGGLGTSTQALCFGGNDPGANQSTKNESWNGTSWSEVNDLGTGIAHGIAPAGGSIAGLASGGQSAPGTQNTVSQEFDAPATLSTVTVS